MGLLIFRANEKKISETSNINEQSIIKYPNWQEPDKLAI